MELKVQKRLSAQILKVAQKRIKFDQSRVADIKEAITKTDIRTLIGEGAITFVDARSNSRHRARKRAIQKRKGLQKGAGKKKGTPNARQPTKTTWINRIRLQRKFLRELKEKKLIPDNELKKIYMKSKGGFFRSRRHLKIYLQENNLLKKK